MPDSTKSSKSSQGPTNEKPDDGDNETAVVPSEAVDAEKQASPAAPDESNWVTGVKLWIIMTGVTLVCFLMMLDMSILSTVSGT